MKHAAQPGRLLRDALRGAEPALPAIAARMRQFLQFLSESPFRSSGSEQSCMYLDGPSARAQPRL